VTAIGKNLERFRQAINAHDYTNPTHTAHGIALSHFDMQRLGFDDGEALWSGITIHTDHGQTAMCRVLCDGEHAGDGEQVEATVRDAAGVAA
jgi:hypothetical protein